MRILTVDPVHRYAAAVGLAGTAVLAALVLSGETDIAGTAPPEFWLFAALLLVGELLPIRALRRARDHGVTVSTTFSFALLLTSGTGPAVLVQAVASLMDDVLRGKPAIKCLFNVGQYSVCIGIAGAFLGLISELPQGAGRGYFDAGDVPAIVVAGGALLLLNQLLPGIALALSERAPVTAYVRRYFNIHTPTAGMLLGLAPIAVVTADFSYALFPFLILPLVAIYEGRRQATLNEHQALHDSLTQLPNRVLYREQVQQACLEAERRAESAVVMLIDLDRFKDINDTLGHHTGDLLLEQIGMRLRSALRESDMVARLGGDEFAILLPGVATEGGIEVGAKIHGALRQPFELRDLRLDVDASIGIACFPDHGADVDTLIQRADVAMYVAKERGTGLEVYAREQDRHSADRLAMIGDLRQAIERRELTLHYQPKVELETGEIRGVEALVRWEHPERGFVSPGEFVPLAEHTGLIRPLTMLVLERAIEQGSLWRKSGLDLKVAVNLSVVDLIHDDLPRAIERLLDEHELDGGALELEITESTIMAEPTRAAATLDRLSAMGIALVIDDFGTGYSSLAYLKRLPVNELKIDRGFILDMSEDDQGEVIVAATIDLGHRLGLSVVAEGVETAEARDRLEELGCDFVQGYLVGRPVPAAQISTALAAAALA